MRLNLFKKSGDSAVQDVFVPTEDERKLIGELSVNQMGFREAQEVIESKVADPLRRGQVWGQVRDQRARDSRALDANRPGVERL